VLNNLEILVEVILVLEVGIFCLWDKWCYTGEGDNLDSLSDSQKKKTKICFKTHLFFWSNTGWWRCCLIFWMVKTLWFFFALAKPSKSPPKGERRVKGKISTTFCPLRKKSYHSYWQWGRNFVLRNFLVVCGCDFPFFLSKCPKGSTRCHTTPGHSHCASKKGFLQILLKSWIKFSPPA